MTSPQNPTKHHNRRDNFSPEQIGRKAGAFGGARLLKFVDGRFVTREGEEIGPDKELVVLGLEKVVQKFVGRKLLDTIIVPDGAKVPNLKEMNDAAPREEWGVDLNNNPVGPYTLVLVLKLINVTLDRFAFITNSVGGSIAIGDLSDKTRIMRRFRGPNVSPVVSLGVTTFRTNFGPKKRPDFRIVRWITLSADVLPGPDRPTAAPTPAIGRHDAVATSTIAVVDQPAPAPAAATPAAAPAAAAQSAPTLAAAVREGVTLGTPVDPPSLKEEMADDLPF